ncbi:antitoxin Xre-like helix-turn-helix domain-containing protein [Alkalimarinus alittae]|uniref:antitoxin Xre-like helix-turn-helix domain-containing protein n=1 Tax=Alkalimarinus alittae TaxID=2961619 RepID=UPI0038782888
MSGLDKKEQAKVTVITPATLKRRFQAGRFNRDESDRLFRFAKVLKAAIDLFEGDINSART